MTKVGIETFHENFSGKKSKFAKKFKSWQPSIKNFLIERFKFSRKTGIFCETENLPKSTKLKILAIFSFVNSAKIGSFIDEKICFLPCQKPEVYNKIFTVCHSRIHESLFKVAVPYLVLLFGKYEIGSPPATNTTQGMLQSRKVAKGTSLNYLLFNYLKPLFLIPSSQLTSLC